MVLLICLRHQFAPPASMHVSFAEISLALVPSVKPYTPCRLVGDRMHLR